MLYSLTNIELESSQCRPRLILFLHVPVQVEILSKNILEHNMLKCDKITAFCDIFCFYQF